ncbi:MAG: hypothetical protein WB626_05475 [Bacteroidota bacterium]
MHTSDEELQSLLEGDLQGEREGEIRSHLAACPACAVRLEEFLSLDAELRAMPLESTGADFTARVLRRIPGASASPLPERFLGWAASLVGMCAVLGTMAAVLAASGVFSPGKGWVEGSEAGAAAGSALREAVVWLGQAAGQTERFLPFAFQSDVAALIMMMLGALGAAALADRFVGRHTAP